MKRAQLIEAAQRFPFDDRFWKGPVYLDFYAAPYLDPHVAVADIQSALREDPYAPDLLNAMVFFSIRLEDIPAAQKALNLFMATENNAIPTFLHPVTP